MALTILSPFLRLIEKDPPWLTAPTNVFNILNPLFFFTIFKFPFLIEKDPPWLTAPGDVVSDQVERVDGAARQVGQLVRGQIV